MSSVWRAVLCARPLGRMRNLWTVIGALGLSGAAEVCELTKGFRSGRVDRDRVVSVFLNALWDRGILQGRALAKALIFALRRALLWRGELFIFRGLAWAMGPRMMIRIEGLAALENHKREDEEFPHAMAAFMRDLPRRRRRAYKARTAGLHRAADSEAIKRACGARSLPLRDMPLRPRRCPDSSSTG